ncbi:MAG: AAA family ATPase [Verrucomicrobiota bacterium]
MKLPSNHTPLTHGDFVGPARHIAPLLDEAIRCANENDRAPIKMIFLGPPGTGKSALARYMQHQLKCHPKWSTVKLNGSQVDLETVENLASSLHLRDLFSEWKFIWFEEIDQCTPKAQVRLLTLLDDQPTGTAIVCTSNCKLNELESRFQSRWKFFDVKPPTAADIHGLLVSYGLDEATASQISTFACGNVRAALLDAELAMQAQATMKRS